MAILKAKKEEIGTMVYNFAEFQERYFYPSYSNQSRLNKMEGKKVTLSIKVGKRRKMVSGQIKLEYDYTNYGGSWFENWYFTPNNPEKLERILNAH